MFTGEQPEIDAAYKRTDDYLGLSDDRGLPDAEYRPLASAAFRVELDRLEQASALTRSPSEGPDVEELIGRSRIARIHSLPYAAIHLPALVDELGGLDAIDADVLYDYFCADTHSEEHPKSINSTMRNVLLARELNKTVLKDSRCSARLAVTEYNWQDKLAAIHNQNAPELPSGYENQHLYKLVVTLVSDDDPKNRQVFFDYGETEGDENRATGENLSMMSLWSFDPIDPEDPEQLRKGLDFIARSQDKESHHKAVELLNLSRELEHYVEIQTLIDPFPLHLAEVEDLTESQIDTLSHIGRTAMKMWEVYVSRGEGLSYQRIVPWKDRLNVVVQMKQPSTRTVLAAMDAAKAVGLKPIKLDQRESSQAKNESPASEVLTFSAQNIAAILSRDPDFEDRTSILTQNSDPENDQGAIRISLGGNRHHPTQTLAELFTLMEHYGCASLGELRERTGDDPPSILVMGHTSHKRADQSFIEFVAQHLPEWPITVLVPTEEYTPKGLALPDGTKYKVIVDANITDQNHLADLTKDIDFIYISNSEGTAHGLGQGAAFERPNYYLSRGVVERNGLTVLAPLPASTELDPQILSDNRHNHFIRRTIEYKNAVVAAALLMMLASRRHQTTEKTLD
jgi:aspartate carbamoyltransferase catalytic subunit